MGIVESRVISPDEASTECHFGIDAADALAGAVFTVGLFDDSGAVRSTLSVRVPSTESTVFVFVCDRCGHRESVSLSSFIVGPGTTFACRCGGTAIPRHYHFH